MVRVRPALSHLILAVLFFAPQLALAGPAEPTQEESADATFANSFLGKTYDEELEVEGWIDLGGGLVAPPIYVPTNISVRKMAPTSCSQAAKSPRRPPIRRPPSS
jgi:hypothetical protein